MIGTALIVVSILIIGIWIVAELRRFQHQILAVILIALVLFLYLSFSTVVKNNDIDYKSPSGLIEAGKIYFSWIGGLAGNFKSITTHAINMDWGINETES